MSGKVDLVFQGGGVKGVGLVGALAVLEEHGYEAQNRAGTSAGAIVATLHAAGYSAKELYDIVTTMPFTQFQDRGWEDRIPLAGPLVSILKDQGIFEGKRFESWFRELLAAKDVTTFADLVHPEYRDQERYRYTVNVIASDVTERRMLVLPQDAATLGIEPDDLDVALAVRMSMSIPIYFEPVRVKDAGGREHLIVDGGMLSNFPVWLFDSDGPPDWPTFGLMLVEPEPRTPVGDRIGSRDRGRGPVAPTIGYVKDLVDTLIEGRDRFYLERAEYARTIPIPTLGVRTTEFDLSEERKQDLYRAGRDAAERFLATWSFEGYVAEFRAGRERPSRREMVGAEMRAAARAAGR